VFVYGARADVEDFADLAVGFAAADPQEDFGFAAGELQGLLEKLLVAAGRRSRNPRASLMETLVRDPLA
jgi:hypothetical protein